MEQNTSRDKRVTLQVGERRFITFRDTLIGESEYFAARLSGRWDDADEDGSYFVDSNPALFEHILNYLRSGSFPVFFDVSTHTFDHAKYLYLLGEARYFGVSKLVEWIQDKEYLHTVSVTRSVVRLDEVEEATLESYLNRTPGDDRKVDISTSWGIRKVYLCPRRILCHRGNPAACGRACENARERMGGDDDYADEDILRAVITTTTTTFNQARFLSDESASASW